VNTLRAQLIFPSKPNFCNLFEFPVTKSIFKNQYLPHLSFENCEINSIKSDLLITFQQHQEHLKIPMQFSVWILLNFHWKNDSIINSFHTVGPDSLKHQWVQPYSFHSFPKIPRAQHEARRGLGDLRVTKQNKLPCCFMDKWVVMRWEENTLSWIW
jgi:hypothetical protein